MSTYIKKNVKGRFLELPDKLSEKLYNNIGEDYQDYLDGLWVLLSDEQEAFHKEHPTANVLEVWNMALTPPRERTLQDAQNEKKHELESYHQQHVSDFQFDGTDIWLSEIDRASKISEATLAKEEGKLVAINEKTALAPTLANCLMSAMSDREAQCKMYVENKKTEIDKLEDVETVDALDVTTAYPATTSITLPDLENRDNTVAKTSVRRQIEILLTKSINTLSLTDEEAEEVKLLYPEWSTFIGKSIPKDYRFQYKGVLYKCLQEHTAQEQWIPGTTGTESLYAVVSASASEEHAGTIDDPIPYVQNMPIEKDKYYTQDGKIYVGIQTTITGYPFDLKDMASVVQEVSIESKESFNL